MTFLYYAKRSKIRIYGNIAIGFVASSNDESNFA
jgi:hypothetical protein